MAVKLKDTEFAEIRHGNALWIACQGNHKCGGWVRVPFSPTIGGAPEPQPTGNGIVWKRESGETLDDLTLSPSIDAGVCGHYFVRNGAVV